MIDPDMIHVGLIAIPRESFEDEFRTRQCFRPLLEFFLRPKADLSPVDGLFQVYDYEEVCDESYSLVMTEWKALWHQVINELTQLDKRGERSISGLPYVSDVPF